MNKFLDICDLPKLNHDIKKLDQLIKLISDWIEWIDD